MISWVCPQYASPYMCCQSPSVPYASRVCSQALVIISRRRGPYGEKAGACMTQPATRSG